MRFPAFLAHYRRLLAIGLLSLLLHLAAIAWIDARLAPPVLMPGNPALALRLADLAPATHAVPAVPPPQAADPAEAPSEAPALATAPDAGEPAAAPPPPAPAPPPPPASGGDVELARMPGVYRVAPPPSGRIDYAVTRAGAGGAPEDAGSASMAWHNDGNRYRVDLDGILGELNSEGRVDDAGIAPDRALQARGTGRLATVFDRAGDAIGSPDGRAYPLVPGSQDAASLLLQLAGIGLAEAGQVRRELEFWVAGPGGAAIERYRVLGPERIGTAAGPFETVRLARETPPGSALLELWLAPAHAWLPVQLRLTAPDGAVTTQTLAAIEIAAAPQE